MTSIMWVVSVLIAAGVFGGVVNYFLTAADEPPGRDLSRSITIGVGASFLVPLFLNMTSSNLIDEITGGTVAADDGTKLLILAGFCLVASISSSRFINSVSDRLLSEVKEAKREAKKARIEAEEVQQKVQPIIEKATEPEDGGGVISEAFIREGATGVQAASLRPEEAVLAALASSRYSFRSLAGLVKETNLDPAEVQTILSDLVLRGDVGVTGNNRNARWHATADGRLRLHIALQNA